MKLGQHARAAVFVAFCGIAATARGAVIADGRAQVDWGSVRYSLNGEVSQPVPRFSYSACGAHAQWNGAKDWPDENWASWPVTSGDVPVTVGDAHGHGAYSADMLGAEA